MKRTALLFFALLLSIAISFGQTVIASQNFNGLSDSGTSSTDAVNSGSALTNTGSMNTTTSGMMFQSFWLTINTATTGPNSSSFDPSDAIGVNSAITVNSPSVSPTGTPVASGSEHNFIFNDTDGRVEVRFAPIDLSSYTNVNLAIASYSNSATFENSDLLEVVVSDGTTSAIVLTRNDVDLEDHAEEWVSFNESIEGALAGLDRSSITLIVAGQVNSENEFLFVDDIVLTGEPLVLVPTMEDWTLFILALLMSNVALVFMYTRKATIV